MADHEQLVCMAEGANVTPSHTDNMYRKTTVTYIAILIWYLFKNCHHSIYACVFLLVCVTPTMNSRSADEVCTLCMKISNGHYTTICLYNIVHQLKEHCLLW